MKRIFIQLASFAREVDQLGIRELIENLESEILKNLECGDLVPGTPGVRKMRLADSSRGKGKRGGFRVIYIDLPQVEKVYLLLLYAKGEKLDLSGDEKESIRGLVAKLKKGF